ncbi:MAG: hypothetical protein AB7I37_18160 [Pirellulales bacterium]
MKQFSARQLPFLLALVMAIWSPRLSIAQENVSVVTVAENGPADKDEDKEKINYGPGPCHKRGTLFQWSYGTSFSGGPDLSEPIVTDRPDFTEASVTVGQGVA